MPVESTVTALRVEGSDVSVNGNKCNAGGKTAQFDHVVGDSHEKSWAAVGNAATNLVLTGKNANIIFFGPSNAGQYHSLLGNLPFPLQKDKLEQNGILPRACCSLFDAVVQGNGQKRLELTCFDIYKDDIVDLLSVTKTTGASIGAGSSGVPQATGITKSAIGSVEDLSNLLEAAFSRRALRISCNTLEPSFNQLVVQLHFSEVNGDSVSTAVLSMVVFSTTQQNAAGANGVFDFQKWIGYQAKGSNDGKTSSTVCKLLSGSVGGNAKTFLMAALKVSDDTAKQTLELASAIRSVDGSPSEWSKASNADISSVAKWSDRVDTSQSLARSLFDIDPNEVAKRGKIPHLINLHPDHSVDRQIVYFLNAGECRIGRSTASIKQTIQLDGLGISDAHCIISNAGGDLTISNCDPKNKVYVNGKSVAKSQNLHHGDRLRIGGTITFGIAVPAESSGAQEDVELFSLSFSQAEAEVHGMETKRLQKKLSSKDVKGSASSEQVEAMGDEVKKLLPLIHEANSISDDLGKGVSFDVKVIAASSLKGDASSLRQQVSVQVTYESSGGEQEEVIWDTNEFITRLYQMREMYQVYTDSGRSMLEVNKQFTEDDDPFFNKGNEHLIGRALIYLDALKHLLPVDEATPIINFKGFARGDLMITLTPSIPSLSQQESQLHFDKHETVKNMIGQELQIKLHIKGARGIPSNVGKDTFVKCRFFVDEQFISTDKCPKKTINPKFGLRHTWKLMVTEELCSYFATDVLEFLVYGSSEKAKKSAKSADGAEGDGTVEGKLKMEYEAKLAKRDEEIYDLKDQLKYEMNEKQHEIDDLKERINEYSKTEDVMKARLDEKSQQGSSVKALQSKLDLLQKDKDNAQDELKALLEEKNNMKINLVKLEAQAKRQLDKIKDLEEQLAAKGKSKACTIL